MSKSLAFFMEQTVEMPAPIFSLPALRKRGRKSVAERYFPDGTPRPSRQELLNYVLHHILYQIDPDTGPVFCRHVMKPNRERNRESMYHVVLGPHEWCGVWEIIGNRRMLDLRAVYLERSGGWLPQLVLSPGNYIGVGNLNGVEMDHRALRQALIARGFVDAETFDRFAAPSLADRYFAVRYAKPGIWM